MDKKELLLKLVKELEENIKYLYDEEAPRLKAHLGEILSQYGSLFSNIGWALIWANEETQNRTFQIIEDALQKKHLLKCRLEEWLRWKISDVVNEVLRDKKEPKQTETRPEELPF
jgi:hypothetical protein